MTIEEQPQSDGAEEGEEADLEGMDGDPTGISFFICIEDEHDHWLDIVAGEEPLVRKQLTVEEYTQLKDAGVDEV